MGLRLKDCTKPELLFIIQQLKLHCGSSGEYYLTQALGDVQMQRLEARHTEADRLSALSYRKRQEYITLLSPYEGARLSEIPPPVLEAADAAMKEVHAADRKWANLMLKER